MCPRRIESTREIILGVQLYGVYATNIGNRKLLLTNIGTVLKFFPSDTERTRVKNLCQVMEIVE